MSPRITSLGVPGSASSTGASRHGKSPHSSSTHQDKDSYMDMEMDMAQKTTGELFCSPAGATRRPTTRSRTVQMRTVQIRLCGVWGVGVGTSTGADAAGGFGGVGARDGETSANHDVDDDSDGDEVKQDLNRTSYLEHGAHLRACARAPHAPFPFLQLLSSLHSSFSTA